MDKVISRLVNGGARVADDARGVMDSMPDDQKQAFRDAVRSAINEKAANNPVKARKIYYSLGDTARAIYGPEFARVKNELDKESRAAVRKKD